MAMNSGFEEQYQDVLQNIEFAIVSVYRRQPTLVDFEVDSALEALARQYQAETQNRERSLPLFTPLTREVYDDVRAVCEWRLGRQDLSAQDGRTLGVGPEPKTLDEIIACLKRIRLSVKRWTKQGGRQGYVQFIDQFIV
jgi:hypothetical protein